MAGGVIQGFFPRGVVQPHAAVQQRAPSPGWVQARIAGVGAKTQAVTQPKAAPARQTPNGSATQLPPPFQVTTAGGQPLPAAIRQKMEAALGQRFDDVRVHVGPQAQAIGALAFTHGSHIHFSPGQYDPHTQRGQHVLAHELAHVVQQRAGRVRNPFGSGIAVVRDALLEAEADRLAHRALAMAPARAHAVQRFAAPPGRTIQRSSSEEVWYVNDKGAGLAANDYQALQDLIRNYDVPLDQDFSRGSSSGNDALGLIAIGLTSIMDWIARDKSRKQILNFVFHPGKGGDSRSKKYGGKTFMQILDMCAKGDECHNDLAKALGECLDTLKPEN